MILARAILFNIGFVLMILVLAVLGLPTIFLGWRAVMGLGALWSRLTFAWLRLSVGLGHEIRGRGNLPDGPVIMAIKHQSAWETLALNLVLRHPAIVYKRELRWLPLVGWYVWRGRNIAIDRRGGAGALRAMIAAAKRAIADGRSIAIFPEGTRGPVGGKLPYQPGVGALYAQLGVPLVPVAVNSGLYWGRKAFTKRPGRVVMEILPPIPPGLDRRTATALLEERIETATARLVAEGRGETVRLPPDGAPA